MTVGPFPASLRAHGRASVETKRNGEDQKESQDFLVHTVGKAQGVRGVAASLCRGASRSQITATERGGYNSQQLAHAVDRAEINPVRTAAQELLRHQIYRIVALRRHHLRQRGFILAAPRDFEKIAALR